MVVSEKSITFALVNKKQITFSINQLKDITIMAKTNFNINKTDVYYTLIKNEVYALRFKALLVNIPSLSERELYIDKSDNKTGINNQ